MAKKIQAQAAPLAGEELKGFDSGRTGGAWKFFVALAIVGLIVLSLQYLNQRSADQELVENRHNGFDFVQTAGGLWVTQITVDQQPYNIPFYYHPRDTSLVLREYDAAERLLVNPPKEIVISVDPDAGSRVVVAAVEISRLTGSKYNLLNIPTSSALSRQQEGVDIPVVTCEDASEDRVVVRFIEDSEANAIIEENDCIVLFYKDPEESVRVADAFAYMLLQIV